MNRRGNKNTKFNDKKVQNDGNNNKLQQQSKTYSKHNKQQQQNHKTRQWPKTPINNASIYMKKTIKNDHNSNVKNNQNDKNNDNNAKHMENAT
jgi:hypothetical protein